MRLGVSVLGIASAYLYSSCALAGESGISTINCATTSYRSVISFFGGYANINAGGRVSYLGSDGTVYSYRSSKDGQSDGFLGGFIGIEHPISWYNLLVQAGLEYSYFGPVGVEGLNTVSMTSGASTLHRYRYNLLAHQFLASAKFLTTTHGRYHPYVSAGIGAAVTNMENFRVTAVQESGVNTTPFFSEHNATRFSYSVGLGVDVDVNQYTRLGLGYRFSGLGDAALKRGQMLTNNELVPVPFALGVHNTHANQLVAQITFVV
ncbi:acyloxyacyl hydrolase [Legionella lytica]|uniref:Acyloxyacyl hydrolase n=1 Tax=Legionella lytica TaxID=96232 RepID=A0ABY4YBM8_9GAMM|nr:acyloxyacyl hydrolase [Legionella lytica]USQ14841.1 acyloxyacyl hydrolase [Legionella lytica]